MLDYSGRGLLAQVHTVNGGLSQRGKRQLCGGLLLLAQGTPTPSLLHQYLPNPDALENGIDGPSPDLFVRW